MSEFKNTAKMNSTIETLLEHLQSPMEDVKECACNTLAGLLDERSAADLFLSAGIVRIIGPLIANDSESPDVLKTALGAMRNLSVEGEAEGCERMVEQNIMGPLVAVLRRLLAMDDVDRVAVGFDVALVQALHLLCNLCENSETAMNVINDEELIILLIPVLLSTVKSGEEGTDVRLAVAQSCLVMADNNASMAQHILSKANQGALLSILMARQEASPKSILLRTLIAGIIGSFVTDSLAISVNDELIHVTVETVLEALHQDTSSEYEVLQRVQSLSSNGIFADEATANSGIAAQTASGAHQHSDVYSTPSNLPQCGDVVHSKLAGCEHLLRAKKVCLELITNVAAGFSDAGSEDGWEDCSETSDRGSVESMEVISSVAPSVADGMEIAGSSDKTNSSSRSMYTSLITKDVIEILFNLSCPTMTDEEVEHKIFNDSSITAFLAACRKTQVAALICVGNILEATPLEILGGSDVLECFWTRLTRMTSSKVIVSNVALLEATMNALRAVACRLGSIGSTKLSEITAPELKSLHVLAASGCTESGIRTSVVRIMCAVGCALSAQTPAAAPARLLSDILEFLFSVASMDADLSVAAESLDSIFDVFAEDGTDEILTEFGLISKLVALAPVFKQKVRAQKKQLAKHRAIIASTLDVLKQFLAYKTTERGLK